MPELEPTTRYTVLIQAIMFIATLGKLTNRFARSEPLVRRQAVEAALHEQVINHLRNEEHGDSSG
jgi:hypothetical protein